MSDWLALHLTHGFTAVEADGLAYLLFIAVGVGWLGREIWRRLHR